MIRPSTRRALRSALVAGVVVLTSRAAQATPSTSDVARAETLFESGKAALAKGDLRTACANLDESQRLDPAVGTLLNLASCEERSGRLAIAFEHFTLARGQLPADDFRVPFTGERIDGLSKRVAHLIIRAPKGASGVRVSRDGVGLTPASFDVMAVVDPGSHVVAVENGASSSRFEVVLAEGETRTVDVPAPSVHAALPVSAEPVAGPSRTLAYVTLGAGAAGVIAGAITGILTINAASRYHDHCVRGECDAEGLSAASTGRTVSVVSPIAFAVGAVGVGLGTYLLIAAPHARTTNAAAQTTSVAPLLGAGAAGFGFARTW